ncbi:reverse transcriptase domain-containing protein [Tanacetum coccineum]
MYVRGGRRDVLRIHSQHQGAESMFEQGRCCPKSSISKMLKRRAKNKQKARKLEQTTEAEEAFKQIKQLIAELPVLTAPMEKEELIVYFAVAKETVSAVLMTEREAKQIPIYFVSRALRGPEINYTSMEKLVLALVHANGSGAGPILTNPEGMEFTYALRFRFDAINNEAEYKALITGLKITKQMGFKNLQANVDSWLMANQVNGAYVAKEPDMSRYLVKSKPQSRRRNKSKIGRKEQEVDGRAFSCSMGTPHHVKSSNGDTPFSLTYGTEAVIPAEIGMPTLRTAEVDLVQNNEALEINLDLLEERREQAAIHEAKSKAIMEKYYNSKVKNTSFKPGDLVYRNNDASHTEDTWKLGPKWEGSYEVTEALGKGAYKLRDRDGKQLPQTWNVSNLKKCYIHKM